MMKSDLWTQDFDGFGKPGERCVPAGGEELKSGTPAVTQPQRSLALPMMALQRPLGASDRWEQDRGSSGHSAQRSLDSFFFSGPTDRWKKRFQIR
ncbi:hypothetical protein C2S51_011260 [Perilla frutescens var. frutescens]|nr:hypothetical protein C2S51_011260 [Perilla frutescens var. frutescens]